MPEYTACQIDEMRTAALIARLVSQEKRLVRRKWAQAPEPRVLGAYRPPGPGKPRPSFKNSTRQPKLAPPVVEGSLERPETAPPGPEGRFASAGAGEAGMAEECRICLKRPPYCRCFQKQRQPAVAKKPRVHSADLYHDGRESLLIAYDGEHRELWRRGDYGAIQSAYGLKRQGTILFQHHGSGK